MRFIVGVILFLPLFCSQTVLSEPTPTIKYLMNEPVSMLDWGIYNMAQRLRPLQEHKDVIHVLDTEAWICYRKGDYEKARDILLGVEEKARDMPVISYHLGMILLQLGEKEKAMGYLESAVNSKETFPGIEEARAVLEQ